jgi:hypothetical protein
MKLNKYAPPFFKFSNDLKFEKLPANTNVIIFTRWRMARFESRAFTDYFILNYVETLTE